MAGFIFFVCVLPPLLGFAIGIVCLIACEPSRRRRHDEFRRAYGHDPD